MRYYAHCPSIPAKKRGWNVWDSVAVSYTLEHGVGQKTAERIARILNKRDVWTAKDGQIIFYAIRNEHGMWAEFKMDGTISWTNLEFAFKFLVEQIADDIRRRDYPSAQLVKVTRND